MKCAILADGAKERLMVRAYILSGAIFLSILGCQPAQNRHSSGEEKVLNDSQIQELHQVNQALSDSVEAAHQAFGATPSSSGRVDRLRKMIGDGKCQQTVDGAESRFDHPWTAQWEVSSSDCPTLVFEYSDFKHDQGKWLYSRLLQPKSPDYQAASGLGVVRASGSLERDREGLVSGKIKYDPFEVADIGQVLVDVIVQTTPAHKGLLRVRVRTQDAKADGRIEWSDLGERYFVNGAPVEAKQFTDLFSAFQPLEIMDRARNFR